MPVPIRCLDESLRSFAERFREQFSKPQYQYFVTVLLGLMECEGRRTLSGLRREVGEQASLAGLSRFLSEAPWREADVNARRIQYALQQTRAHRRGKAESILVLDDTLCEHVGSL